MNSYLRFLPNGRVEWVSTNADAAFVARTWYGMRQEAPNFVGRFQVTSDGIKLVDGTQREYRGAFSEGQLKLRGNFAGGWPSGVYEFVPLELVDTPPPPEPTAVPPPTRPPRPNTLRFDGLYALHPGGDDGSGQYLRFWPDGWMAEGPLAIGDDAAVQRIARLGFAAFGRTGRYKITGRKIAFSIRHLGGADEYSGTIETNQLALEMRTPSGTTSGVYQFRSVPGTGSQEFPRAANPAGAPGRAGTAPVEIELGEATLDEKCAALRFTPALKPFRFPVGTTKLAYRVTISPAAQNTDVGVRSTIKCGTPQTSSKRCNDFVIVNGQPVNNGWTTIVSCGDGGPFRAGAYKLELSVGGAVVREIPFTIR
jgi:hypothetical protein